MNTGQITEALKNHHKTRDHFLACCPSDEIPSSTIYPYSVVVNTDDSTKQGAHWVCIYAPNSHTADYFDSYAMEPNTNISLYLDKFEKVVKNTRTLQGLLSDVCGQYCIYFLVRKSSRIGLDTIVKYLSKIRDRDKYVEEFVAQL